MFVGCTRSRDPVSTESRSGGQFVVDYSPSVWLNVQENTIAVTLPGPQSSISVTVSSCTRITSQVPHQSSSTGKVLMTLWTLGGECDIKTTPKLVLGAAEAHKPGLGIEDVARG